MIHKLKVISYEMRLRECLLTPLETRRLRGDQIEVFKILNGYENIYREVEMRFDQTGRKVASAFSSPTDYILRYLRIYLLYLFSYIQSFLFCLVSTITNF